MAKIPIGKTHYFDTIAENVIFFNYDNSIVRRDNREGLIKSGINIEKLINIVQYDNETDIVNQVIKDAYHKVVEVIDKDVLLDLDDALWTKHEFIHEQYSAYSKDGYIVLRKENGDYYTRIIYKEADFASLQAELCAGYNIEVPEKQLKNNLKSATTGEGLEYLVFAIFDEINKRGEL